LEVIGMKAIGQKDIRLIQFEVMQNLHDFMTENGLRYSLACGTLIGVVRHKGYIPWDDDIDIYMPRVDYKRLLELFPDTYREHYKLASYERCPQWHRAYANVYDDRTIWDEEKAKGELTIGINVDVFPVDHVPDDENEREVFIRNRNVLNWLWIIKHTSIRGHNRSLAKYLSVLFLKLLFFPLPARKVVRFIDKYTQKYNTQNSDRLFGLLGGVVEKKPFLKKDFDELLQMPFEGHYFNVMKGYDDCLKNSYGNYMELPPLEKRKTHHYYQAYIKE